MLWKGFSCGPAVLMKVSAMSWNVVADFFARASAYSFPMIPAWDLSLKKWMGDGDGNGLEDISLDVVAVENRV